MKLQDCKIGDKVKVYLGSDGELHASHVEGSNVKLGAVIVGTYRFTNGCDVMLGWDKTAGIVPNNTSVDVCEHNTLGYSFMSEFHQVYKYTVWAKGNLGCEMENSKSVSTRKYPDDQCKCGIHLTLQSCEYHE